MVMSIEAMAAGGCTDAVVVVNDQVAKQLGPELAALPIPVQQVPGGASRQESVYNGLKAVRDDERLSHAEVVLIRNYRYAVEEELLELPAGTLEPGVRVQYELAVEEGDFVSIFLSDETGDLDTVLRIYDIAGVERVAIDQSVPSLAPSFPFVLYALNM